MKKQSKPEQEKDIADATETLDSNIKRQLKEQQEKELVKTDAKRHPDKFFNTWLHQHTLHGDDTSTTDPTKTEQNQRIPRLYKTQ